MIEDENMQKANRITVLRAKREYQMIKKARQQKQQQIQQQQQQKLKKIIEQIENKVNEDGKRPRNRSVICITTGEIFNTIKDATERYHVHATNISQCCRGKVKHTGQLPDGTPLEWRYIDLNNRQN